MVCYTSPIPVKGICPANWHMPSDDEWNDLEREIYNNLIYTEAEKNSWTTWNVMWEVTVNHRPLESPADAQGSAMKSPCPPVGSVIATNGKSLTARQGGFDFLLVGDGDFLGNGITAYGSQIAVHSSSNSSFSTDGEWIRYITSDRATVYRMGVTRSALGPVRCVRSRP